MVTYNICGNKVEAWIDNDHYYCTGSDGCGVFYVDTVRNDRQQILGTAQFSVNGVKDKKAKFSRFLKEYRSAL